MSNVYLTLSEVTQEALDCLENSLTFSKAVTREYDDKFAVKGGKIGDTLNIRRPSRFTVSSGAALSVQDAVETSIPLVINYQDHIDVSFTSADLTLKADDFSGRVLKPAMIQLANQVDQRGTLMAKNSVGNLVGTPGTAPSTVANILLPSVLLDQEACPRDGQRYFVADPSTNASMIAGLSGLFNNPKNISDQYTDGAFTDMTSTLGLKISMDQAVATHTTGPLGGTPLVNGASQGITSGWASTTSLAIKGWTAAAAARLSQGDVFTIANVFAVNPLTRTSTGVLRKFVVTASVSSDGSGNLTAVVSPAIISGGQFQNVNSAPADSAAITVIGTAGTGYVRNIVYHKSAFVLGCVDLPDVGDAGALCQRKRYKSLSLRLVQQYNITTDVKSSRVDILYGWVAQYPELAVQFTS